MRVFLPFLNYSSRTNHFFEYKTTDDRWRGLNLFYKSGQGVTWFFILLFNYKTHFKIARRRKRPLSAVMQPWPSPCPNDVLPRFCSYIIEIWNICLTVCLYQMWLDLDHNILISLVLLELTSLEFELIILFCIIHLHWPTNLLSCK